LNDCRPRRGGSARCYHGMAAVDAAGLKCAGLNPRPSRDSSIDRTNGIVDSSFAVYVFPQPWATAQRLTQCRFGFFGRSLKIAVDTCRPRASPDSQDPPRLSINFGAHSSQTGAASSWGTTRRVPRSAGSGGPPCPCCSQAAPASMPDSAFRPRARSDPGLLSNGACFIVASVTYARPEPE